MTKHVHEQLPIELSDEGSQSRGHGVTELPETQAARQSTFINSKIDELEHRSLNLVFGHSCFALALCQVILHKRRLSLMKPAK